MKEYVNVAILVSVLSWATAQLIKAIIYAIKFRTFNPERLFGSGGMPSSHSSTVCALVITVYRMEGIQSATFGLAMILAMITMYDATGVRRAAGLHAKQINRLRHIVDELDEETLDRIDEKMDDEEEDPDDTKELKEFLGHTPLEVILGALLGILIGVVFPTDLFL
ncbi:MAG: divergent PAP2 family protein [Firmicutes bacterium]|nr:divergent PAP2 family protein [[Eubacterium] siraeum]MCM1487382.1 divergent PAP2 family protein [Bacillota bacterium]